MTTGNVSNTGNVKASFMNFSPVQNTQSAKKTDDFATFLPKSDGKAQSDVKTSSDEPKTTSKDPARAITGKAEKILKKESTVTVKEEEQGQIIEDVASQIKDSIKETLSVSDEDLEKMMAELGFTVQDLLVPQNLAALTAYANGVEPAAIVFDEDMLAQFNEIVSKVESVVDTAADELGITDDQLKDILTQLEEPELTEDTAVKNTDNKSEKVILNSDATEAANTDVQTTKMVSGTEKENRQSDDSSKGESQSRPQTGNVENIMQNITNAVNESISSVSDEFAVRYGVDASDMVEQVLEAVKVTMNEDVTSMEMWLNPQSLGKISISVTAKDGVMMASITTQNESAKAALESQLVQLKQTLNEQGLKVTEVEVNVAAESFNSNADSERQNMSEQNRRQGGRRFRNVDVSDAVSEGVETFADEPALGDGTSLNLKA